MGGYLQFGTRFEPRFDDGSTEGYYASNDQETWALSYQAIEDMIVAGEQLGVSRDTWPYFIDQDGRADLVSPQEVADRNCALAAAMRELGEDQVTSNKYLLLVWRNIREGKQLFIDH